MELTEITAQDLDELYADMEERDVGERTARYVHQVAYSSGTRPAENFSVSARLDRKP